MAVYGPTAQQITLASTVAVHPHFTTRAKSSEECRAVNVALMLLEDTARILGPSHPLLAAGLAFGAENLERRAKKVKPAEAVISDEDELEKGLTRSVFAHGKSVVNKNKDFWGLIGWIFNCSVAHKRRWNAWLPWLRWLVQLLESDWEERSEQSYRQQSQSPLVGSMVFALSKTPMTPMFGKGCYAHCSLMDKQKVCRNSMRSLSMRPRSSRKGTRWKSEKC